MQRTLRRATAATIFAVLAMSLAGCSHDQKKKPVGPDVRGLSLPDAESALKKAKIGFTEHATDATFGIVVKDNFVVCTESYVGPHMVRLNVAKHGC